MAIHSPPSGAPLAIGPYRLDERLGSGGMGEVYRGYDSRLDRPVALKRVRPGLSDPVTALRRFQREARAVARLRHPAIVQVFDWVDDGDEAWLVMELVEGLSLREVMRSGPLSPERGIAMARDLLEGLAVAHEAELVHRDLKPENVMLTPASSAGRGRGEQARILDFGLAKSSVRSEDESGLSIDGNIVGTVSALAPEQVLGQQLDAGPTFLRSAVCFTKRFPACDPSQAAMWGKRCSASVPCSRRPSTPYGPVYRPRSRSLSITSCRRIPGVGRRRPPLPSVNSSSSAI